MDDRYLIRFETWGEGEGVEKLIRHEHCLRFDFIFLEQKNSSCLL